MNVLTNSKLLAIKGDTIIHFVEKCAYVLSLIWGAFSTLNLLEGQHLNKKDFQV